MNTTERGRMAEGLIAFARSRAARALGCLTILLPTGAAVVGCGPIDVVTKPEAPFPTSYGPSFSPPGNPFTSSPDVPSATSEAPATTAAAPTSAAETPPPAPATATKSAEEVKPDFSGVTRDGCGVNIVDGTEVLVGFTTPNCTSTNSPSYREYAPVAVKPGFPVLALCKEQRGQLKRDDGEVITTWVRWTTNPHADTEGGPFYYSPNNLLQANVSDCQT